ncbi:MAG: serine hydrolase domain-containing protein, partial [Limisphaerales bacterium]
MSASGSGLPRTEAILQRGIADGLHPGVQLYVSLKGEAIAWLAYGERRTGEPMTRDTLLLWLSAGKPLTAIAVAQQVESGALGLDDPVARHIPEFDTAGRERITLRHLLTHTAGFSPPDPLPEGQDWSRIVAAICAAPLGSGTVAGPVSEPGTEAAYMHQASWYLLAEIVQRQIGRPYSEHLRNSVLLPFGLLDSWVGMPEEQYLAYGSRIGTTHVTFPGPPNPHPTWDSLEACRACRPGGNARGPIRDLGQFYEGLL